MVFLMDFYVGPIGWAAMPGLCSPNGPETETKVKKSCTAGTALRTDSYKPKIGLMAVRLIISSILP